jgi:putative aminopeptidase FrvX
VKKLIKKLTETYGPSGNEEEVRRIIEEEVRTLTDEMRVDPMGNLISLRKGDGTGLKIMLAAHMDEIGVIVTHVDKEGFLRFGAVGGLRRLSLLGSRVRFANGLIGTIGAEKLESPEKVPSLDKLFIDTGAVSKDSLSVGIGDAACFDRPFVDQGNRLTAKAFDDRIGCAILIQTLRDLEKSPHDVYFVFTVQEEVGLRGAQASAYGVAPDLGIAVDVTTTGDTPEAHPMAVSLGHGPAIKVKDKGMIAHPKVKDLLVETAERLGLPYQMEVLEAGTTDGYAMQVSRSGVPTGVVSIGTRYVHSPSETLDYDDVLNSVRLLVGVLSDPITMN